MRYWRTIARLSSYTWNNPLTRAILIGVSAISAVFLYGFARASNATQKQKARRDKEVALNREKAAKSDAKAVIDAIKVRDGIDTKSSELSNDPLPDHHYRD